MKQIGFGFAVTDELGRDGRWQRFGWCTVEILERAGGRARQNFGQALEVYELHGGEPSNPRSSIRAR
jgi:hypothetical protein